MTERKERLVVEVRYDRAVGPWNRWRAVLDVVRCFNDGGSLDGPTNDLYITQETSIQRTAFTSTLNITPTEIQLADLREFLLMACQIK